MAVGQKKLREMREIKHGKEYFSIIQSPEKSPSIIYELKSVTVCRQQVTDKKKTDQKSSYPDFLTAVYL